MARNNSRFNRLLNFIGLVDESDDRDFPNDDGRPQGASTYNPPPRKGQSGRPARGQDDPGAGYYGRGGNYYDDRYSSPPPRYPQEPARDYRQSSAQGYQSPRAGQQNRRPQPEYDRAQQRLENYSPRSGAARPQAGQPRQQGTPRYEEYPPQSAPVRDYPPPRQQSARVVEDVPAPQDNVVRLHEMAGSRTETVIFFLHRLDECTDVIRALLSNKSVLINLEDMDERIVQRGIDMLSGATFALNATLRQASEKTYLIAPKSVSIENGTKENRF